MALDANPVIVQPKSGYKVHLLQKSGLCLASHSTEKLVSCRQQHFDLLPHRQSVKGENG